MKAQVANEARKGRELAGVGSTAGMAAQGSAQGGDSAHRFYISSPLLGLKKEREEAKKLITRRNHAYGDSYGGSADPLVETCQRDVRASHHYVLILGERYGTRRPEHGNKSVTELEFEAAMEAGLTLHAFFLGFVSDARHGIERDAAAMDALAAFRRRVSDHCVPVDCSDQEDGRSGWQVFTESITALAANPPVKQDLGFRPFPSTRKEYSSDDLRAWVERHKTRLAEAFLALPSVRDRRVHVPLKVRLALGTGSEDSIRLLNSTDLAPLLETRGNHVLLLSGDGGSGKTSQAFAIARLWLQGKPGGVVRIPVLIETGLAVGETIADRVLSWLRGQLQGALDSDLEPELVEMLLAAKRLIPIVDHLSELAPTFRVDLLLALPPGLVMVTSRNEDDGFIERPLSRIIMQSLLSPDQFLGFFVDYLRIKYPGRVSINDDFLISSWNRLRMIVGNKTITVLLAQIFVEDVITNSDQGLLASSVPELMLGYIHRLDMPSHPTLRQREGIYINRAIVLRSLRVIAFASHSQAPRGQPCFQPIEFSDTFALSAIMSPEPGGLGLEPKQAKALLDYLINQGLLVRQGFTGWHLRFPLDPLSDYLAAAEQFEKLEFQAHEQGPVIWESFLRAIEMRTSDDRERMRGFLRAICDWGDAARKNRVLHMPEDALHRLSLVGFDNPIVEVARLQSFFLDYLRQSGRGGELTDDDLIPAQAQLKRIAGDKPITVNLASIFIEDVLAQRKKGLLASSVPQLILSYVSRLDTPSDPLQRHRKGIFISEKNVQKALRIIALAGQKQGPKSTPYYQPLDFGRSFVTDSLMLSQPNGMGLSREDAQEYLHYLVSMRLLLQDEISSERLRFPFDLLSDHLASAEQLEQLEQLAAEQGQEVWINFVDGFERRPLEDREQMRGFLLAFRDWVIEAQEFRGLAIPCEIPDRLAVLGFLDPVLERYRLALQRARKWMWEMAVQVPSERRDGIAKLAAMASSTEESERLAVKDVASRRLARGLAEVVPMPQIERRLEQQEAAAVMGLIGSEAGAEALEDLARGRGQPPELRRVALEALGLLARDLPAGDTPKLRKRIERFLEEQLRADALDLLVEGEEGWTEHDRRLPPLQGASRGLQLAASHELPILGSGPGRVVPSLTLTALHEGEAIRIRTEVLNPTVWKLPMPGGEQLEMVVVPEGSYNVGSFLSEKGRDWYADTQDGCKGVNVEAMRTVCLESFAMARHAITQAQWRVVAELPLVERELNLSPSTYNAMGIWETHAQPGALPVDSVSWYDCQEWLQRLNLWLTSAWTSQGGQGAPPKLTLPGEGQWEAACRGSAGTPFHFGDLLDTCWANYDGTYIYGPGRTGVHRQRPVPVGFFGLVNRWGLAELHGQIGEWCSDNWHPNPNGQDWPADGKPWEGIDPALDGIGSAQKEWRLLRGGSWFFEPTVCRAAIRLSNPPARINTNIGLRPCCLLP